MGVNRKIFKPMFDSGQWKILRGDTVMIMAGRDRGQTGVVQEVIRDPRHPRLIVEGRNLNKRFQKRTGDSPGGVVSVESPLAYSNAMLVDPVTLKPVRADWRFTEDGTRVRVTKGKLASGSIIARPEVLKQRKTPRPPIGEKDTPEAEVNRVTYDPAAPWPFLRELPGPSSRSYSSASAAASVALEERGGRQPARALPGGWGPGGGSRGVLSPLLGARWQSGLSWRGSRGFAAQTA